MAGKCIIVVGMTGTGKSYLIKNELLKVRPMNRLVYDVNAEYTHLYNEPLLKFDQFLQVAALTRNATIIFEEATIFLGHNNNTMPMRSILVEKRHRNNTIFLVFHNLRAVPAPIFGLCDYLILKKTNDNSKKVDSRFNHEGLNEKFAIVKDSQDLYHQEIVNILGI